MYLDSIKSPDDVKKLSPAELKHLAVEVRKFILNTVADTGGHLASNLGVVELTIALHYHLNSPKDKIIWDVGHQSYTHKILTGRKDRLHTIRQHGGLSGFPKRAESIHDIIETGHSSTSISSALGLAIARDSRGDNERIYNVIGDGSMTAGMAFEALNHAGHLRSKMTVILNDNEMSISPNVGALSHHLSNVRTDPTINKLKEDIEFLINRIPKIGTAVSKSVERVKDGLKYILISGIIFKEMGFTYIGPLNGHNIAELLNNFKKADRIEGPVIIHVNTRKGKGYQPAESQPSKYHGVSPFIIDNGMSKKKRHKQTYSEVFGKTMVELGRTNKDLIGITAAMPEGTGLNYFKEVFPERFFDVGIAEQHAVTMAAGLARGGKKPVVAIYSTFLQRAYDQVIHDVCLQDLPVTLAVDRAGIVGDDGETHQGIFDISFLRTVPNLLIMAARNGRQLQQMLGTAINYDGPVVLRYPRGEVPEEELANVLIDLPIAQAEVLQEGSGLMIIAIGSMVYPALEAANLLKQDGIEATVIDACFIKPLDEELFLRQVERHKKVITVEEHVLSGGFGTAILELFSDRDIDIPVKRIGLPDRFIEHGSQEKLYSCYNLTPSAIRKQAREFVYGQLEVGL
ncbi:MAG TPA: 1-deoxy-D-xylulose-5-phosphate synthase [Halanaerobiales bacterium]|nr:1-deoxy-D-xylulose-5-phosphate synthase [Halanaerobiales bacterium]